MTKTEEAKQFYEQNLEDFEYARDITLTHIEHLLKEMGNNDSTVKSRLKTFDSAMEKCKRRNLDMKDLCDIVGIRIVCPFRDDVYNVFEAIRKMPMVTITERKDYIENPKENGYESLHLILAVPIYSNIRGSKVLPVEIQIRTLAMNVWATVEHIVKYKNPNPSPEATGKLKHVAEMLKDFDSEIINLRNFAIAD